MEIDERIDISEVLKKRDPQIRYASPIHVTGEGNITSEKVTFQLHVTGNLILPCSRTLVDVEFPIDIESTETFLLKPSEFIGEDEEVHQTIDDVVDLVPVITEILILEIPIQVFSENAKDDQNLPAGNDWVVLTEDQVKQDEEKAEKKVDPRLAGLANFFDEES